VPNIREELVFDVAELPPGEYTARVSIHAPDGAPLGEDERVTVAWPGRDEDYKGIRVLNNLVWELLNVSSDDTSQMNGPHHFRVPCDRWLLIRTQADVAGGGSLSVILDSQSADDAVSVHTSDGPRILEAKRFVEAGEHTIYVAGAGSARLQSLQVRAIPEIQHSRYPTTVYHVQNGGDYDWEFLSRHILPNVTTIIGGGVPDHIVPYVRYWKQRGGRWILYTGRPGLHEDGEIEESADRLFDHFSKHPGFAHPLMDGVLVDEFYTPNDPVYESYTGMLERMASTEEFRGKCFSPYIAGKFGQDEGSVEFSKACIATGAHLCWEGYLFEWPTKREALDYMRRYPGRRILPFEDRLPGVTREMIWVFGAFSFPWPYADGYPGVNYNAYLDMQFRFLATHPAFFGLGGVHIWRSGYCDEERVRWFGRMFRHYGIEGNTHRLTSDPYLLKHIANPDFTDGTNGWTLQPASEGSMEAKQRPQFGKLQGRHYRGNDTFLWTKRSAERPNIFSQTIRGLQVGRLYSVKMLTGDYGDLAKGRSEKQVHTICVDLAGCDLLEGAKYQYQEPFPTRARVGQFTGQHPFWLNYHWHVFRATGTTAKLTISDWKSPDEPGGPASQELLCNFIEVKPYLEE